MLSPRKAPLHDYQKRALKWMEMREFGYLAVDMGLGKTRTVIEYARASGLRTLVVAPLRVAYNTWPEEIQKWWPEATYTILHGRNKDKEVEERRDFYICNYEGLDWLLTHPPQEPYNMVLDESTKIKNQKAKMTKNAIALGEKARTRWCLSATPFPQGLVDAWSQFRFMDGGAALCAKWYNFTRNYCMLDHFNKYYVPKLVEAPLRAKIKPHMFRLDVNDYLKLPPLITDDRVLSLTPELYADYKRIHREMVIELGDRVMPLKSAAGELSTMRQWLSGRIYPIYPDNEEKYVDIHELKLEMLDSIIEELQGEPALVAIAFRHELFALQKRYGSDLPHITGGVAAETSTTIIDRWNAGKLPLLVVNPAATAHGINLQAGGRHIIWLSLTYNYEHYQQLIGRLHRQGQEKPVVNHRLLFRNTIDMEVARCLENKGANLAVTLNTLKDTLRGATLVQ